MITELTLLCVVAHPDDETFGAGGILAHAVARGARVVTLCATRGEAGEILDRSNATPETLAQVRELEYRRAGQIIGVCESMLLDYRDSGMPGSPENEDPEAFIQQSEERVTTQIMEVMERVRPDVVVASEPEGGYGHPDHIFASKCALAAFDRLQQSRDERGWAPRKFYYFTFSLSLMRKFFGAMAANDTEGDFAKLDPADFATPDDEITFMLDVSEHEERLRAAYAAHLSQISPLERLPDDVGKEFINTSALLRARPGPVTPGDESDIFAGL